MHLAVTSSIEQNGLKFKPSILYGIWLHGGQRHGMITIVFIPMRKEMCNMENVAEVTMA